MEFGIDFGTTRTVVACADRGNHPVVGFHDAAGDAVEWIPSVVAEIDGELRYGLDAAVPGGEVRVVRSFKRLLSSEAGPEQRVHIGATSVPLGDLVAGFVAHVRDALVTRSDVKRSIGSGGLRAAVAVPANAHSAQRLITLDAFRRAGFDSVAMLNEPSAAGFEYTHRHRDTLSSKRDVVVVYDLGGGTFDASVVRMSGRRHEVLATAGIARLGGDDFDEVLAGVTLSRAGIARESLSDAAFERLLDHCRVAKESLNPSSKKVTIDLEAALEGVASRSEITLAVSDFYDACAPLLDRTVETMIPLMGRVDDDEAAAPALDDVAGIYVVGGASELPVVARTLRQRFGRRVHRSPYPSAAVAIGLSIAADAGEGFELVDRYARTFGVFREGEGGREITFDPIFKPDTTLPRTHTERLTETRAYRAAHNVGHFRFFECGAVDGSGRPRGDMTLYRDVFFPFDRALREDRDLSGVHIERRHGEGPPVLERYSLDDSGIVEVVIQDVDSGFERTYRLART